MLENKINKNQLEKKLKLIQTNVLNLGYCLWDYDKFIKSKLKNNFEAPLLTNLILKVKIEIKKFMRPIYNLIERRRKGEEIIVDESTTH
jgi:hypothetical protein